VDENSIKPGKSIWYRVFKSPVSRSAKPGLLFYKRQASTRMIALIISVETIETKLIQSEISLKHIIFMMLLNMQE